MITTMMYGITIRIKWGIRINGQFLFGSDITNVGFVSL